MRQKQALGVMMGGSNVFLTGAPGAGKTYVLNKFVKRAERAGKRIAVTASTGIAASHLGGTTIHSWSGLGILDELSPGDLKKLSTSDKLIKRYNNTDILVIDEVSMLHGKRLDMINTLAKKLRMNETPFGGLQVILVGDLFQLPPISRGSSELDFAHLSEAWAELDPKICYLTEQHRQSSGDNLLDLLTAMRVGKVEEIHETYIKDRLEAEAPESGSVTRLFSHNVDVDSINQEHLDQIDETSRTFVMQTKGARGKVEQMVKSVLAPEVLELKIGAEVMFVANNFGAGYVNGSRGQVIDFVGGLPEVRLNNGRVVKVDLNTWTLSEDGKIRAEISQLPLRLAWAITIHKSQGMSLDAAQIDLSRAFTPGMGYVALSRVRSFNGLYLQGINNMAMNLNPQIYIFDTHIQSASNDLAMIVEDIEEEIVADASVASGSDYDKQLYTELKKWRYNRAKKDKTAPYIVAHDKALEAVAANLPTTSNELLSLPGFGSAKVEKYGDDILKIVANHKLNN